ncbi:MAG: hypothetical protein KME57_14200 [Scytonema hyalinum WJT4-NPBG1]|jgi:hypothetical protein|nr:hypothetical protein [Scytonema hyalinum WJT4-NPBG1]
MDKATELVESISPTVHLRGYMLHREIPDFSGQSNARLIPFQGMQTSKWLTQLTLRPGTAKGRNLSRNANFQVVDTTAHKS